MTDVPIVKAFTIPELGWEFIDKRTFATGQINRAVIGAWAFELEKYFVARGEDVTDFLCAFDAKSLNKENECYVKACKTTPGLERKDWHVGDHKKYAWSSTDQPLFFGVFEKGTPIGGLIIQISTTKVTENETSFVVKDAVMALGVPDRGDLAATWGTIYSHVINSTHPLADGRVLDVPEFVYISPTPGDSLSVGLVAALGANFQVRGSATSERITFARRPTSDVKGAKRNASGR